MSEHISISIDPFTGRNPSYCFVDFNSSEEAQRAIVELNEKNMLGRPLRIRLGTLPRGLRVLEGDPPVIGHRESTYSIQYLP
jgi:RNA recognition motif-containing protein